MGMNGKKMRSTMSLFMAFVLSATLMVPNVAFAKDATTTQPATAAQTAQPAAETASAQTQTATSTETAATSTQAATTADTATQAATTTDTAAATSTTEDATTAQAAAAAPQAAAAESNGAVTAQGTQAASTLPVTYDLRKADNYDSTWPTRMQNPWGCYWAFGSTGSIESNILKQAGGSGASSLNLSERQLAYFSGVPVTSSTVIAGRAIDKDQNGEGVTSSLDSGGTANFAAEILTSWEGLANDSAIPYMAKDGTISKKSDWSLAEYQRSLAAAHVTDVDMLESTAKQGAVKATQGAYTQYENEYQPAGTQAIKEALMKTGAVSIAFHVDQGQYYNDEKGAQYIPNMITVDTTVAGADKSQSTQQNHGVCIVGWDDNYLASNFNSTYQPTENGAFLCRNSWGSYGSYESKSVSLLIKGQATPIQTALPTAPWTDPKTGQTVNVFVDSTGQLDSTGQQGTLDEMFIWTEGGVLDANHPYAENVKALDVTTLDKTYVMSDGTKFTVTQTAKAGTENSPTWDGYFWLSYHDASISSPVVYTAETPDASGKYSSDHLYEYDYLGLSSEISTDEGAFDTKATAEAAATVAQVANVFTAAGNEALTAVSVATKTAANTVEILIYRLINGATSPTQSANGQPEITMTTTIDNAGYHTVHLSKPLYLHAGESFSVVERITNQSGQGYVPLEMASSPMPASSGKAISFTAKSGSGESYISTNGGKTWVDVHTLSLNYYKGKYDSTGEIAKAGFTLEGVGNVMIRAYTQDWTPELTPAPTPSPKAATASAQPELPKTADNAVDACVLLVILAAVGMGTAIGARRKALR